MSDLKREIPLC